MGGRGVGECGRGDNPLGVACSQSAVSNQPPSLASKRLRSAKNKNLLQTSNGVGGLREQEEKEEGRSTSKSQTSRLRKEQEQQEQQEQKKHQTLPHPT